MVVVVEAWFIPLAQLGLVALVVVVMAYREMLLLIQERMALVAVVEEVPGQVTGQEIRLALAVPVS